MNQERSFMVVLLFFPYFLACVGVSIHPSVCSSICLMCISMCDVGVSMPAGSHRTSLEIESHFTPQPTLFETGFLIHS